MKPAVALIIEKGDVDVQLVLSKINSENSNPVSISIMSSSQSASREQPNGCLSYFSSHPCLLYWAKAASRGSTADSCMISR